MGEKENKKRNTVQVFNYEKEGIFLIISGTPTYSFVICSILKSQI